MLFRLRINMITFCLKLLPKQKKILEEVILVNKSKKNNLLYYAYLIQINLIPLSLQTLPLVITITFKSSTQFSMSKDNRVTLDILLQRRLLSFLCKSIIPLTNSWFILTSFKSMFFMGMITPAITTIMIREIKQTLLPLCTMNSC